MWERLKRRYRRLFVILGGILIIVDQIGRYQTVATLYQSGKRWLAATTDIHLNWTPIHLVWPPHMLLGVGAFFVVLGLVSFFWPLTPEPKYIENAPSPLQSAKPTSPQDAAVPHIDLIFDLAKSDETRKVVRNDALKVLNTSDAVAYDVQIQPMESHLYKATFEMIARIEKGPPVEAVMDLRAKPNGAYHKEFEALLRFELENSSEDDGFNVRVPIVVRFYDAKKETLYQTAHEVVYNNFWLEAHVHLVQGTTAIKTAPPPLPDAASLVNTSPGPNKLLVKRIMRGTEKLMAWEIVRDGFPNAYFVEFSIRNLEPKSCVTADYKVANGEWHEWYKEWKKQPGGFGGASGDGLDGTLPW
jgi:hypothetical protein